MNQKPKPLTRQPDSLQQEKKRIIIVSDAWKPQVNGVVRTLEKTIEALERMGHNVKTITPDMFFSMPCPTYPEIRLSFMPGKRLAQLMQQYKPDIIHIATEGPLGWAARRHAIRYGLNFSTAYHTRFPEYIRSRFAIPLRWTYAYLRYFHQASSVMMVPTASVRDDMEKWRIGRPVIWPRGVDINFFKPPEGSRPDHETTGRPVFLYVGRVAVEKNIAAFLDCELEGDKWVVGDGPLLKKLKRRYGEVKFLGMKPMEELPRLYSRASVFVFPSKTDTFGLVLLEAMACGLPVAAYPVAGPSDVIGDSGAGALDNDLEAACLEALRIDRRKARAHAEGFSWERATRIFFNHLTAAEDGTAHG